MIAPLLIDSRGLLKLGFLFTLTAVFIFGSGFFAGFQRANAIQLVGSHSEALVLPERTAASETTLSSYPPEIIEAGENIDVDDPAVTSSVSNHHTETTHELEKKKSVGSAPVDNVPADADVTETVNTPQKSLIKNNTTQLTSVKAGTKDIVNDSEKEVAATVAQAYAASKELNKIKYSVQVGVYEQLMNAENMVKMLQAQQLDAYIADYTNKKNEVRYNVRYGYFSDRKSAIQSLKKFKEEQVGDGYLVRFSADNIVNLADTKAVTQPAVLPTGEQMFDSHKLDKTPAKTSPDNISQAETYTTGALIKSVTKTN